MNADRLAELCKDQVDFTGKCQDCDCEVKVTIKRTDEGFLVTGGAVYEHTRDKFYLKCDECFEREPILKNFQPVECWSRVVGYLRPVGQWNDGKVAEFHDRKSFDVGKALAQ